VTRLAIRDRVDAGLGDIADQLDARVVDLVSGSVAEHVHERTNDAD
jgi:hypothetical protein